MQKFFIIIITVCFFTNTNAQLSDEQKIITTLAAQTTAWNMGDIDAFMQPYWHSDSLLFIGKNGPTYGWANTKANYKKSYPDTATMGKLNFEIIHIKRLSVLYYSVVGKWYLTRSVGNIGGAFTLIFKKIKQQWVIVQDHSS